MSSKVRRKQLAILSTVLFCISAMPAQAATITVTNTNDNGPGSLRQALADANDGDTINFAVAGRITLTTGGLVIDENVTISGPGPGQLSIDGNQTQMCVFAVAVYGTVTISGLTISNGACGIYSDHSTLIVNNCVVRGNSSDGGVSINDLHGPGTHVERRNSRHDAEKVYGDQPFAGHSLTIANSVVSNNTGPGVHNVSAMVTILDSTISGNSTGQDWGYGGGIYSGGTKFPGYVIVDSSTISGNSALYSGGGIACGSSGLTIMNSTISGNSTVDPDYGDGGGVSASSITIANSTVSGNAASICGGICGGTLEIGNTILSANASGNIDGIVTSHGYNISSDDGGGHLNGPGDQINTDPLLGPLRDHGGPTSTHVPMRGSPAIDAGDPSFTPPPDHDQRGACFYRVFGPRIDVGSVETQPRPRCVTPAPRPTP